jgi:hypothetical protein
MEASQRPIVQTTENYSLKANGALMLDGKADIKWGISG